MEGPTAGVRRGDRAAAVEKGGSLRAPPPPPRSLPLFPSPLHRPDQAATRCRVGVPHRLGLRRRGGGGGATSAQKLQRNFPVPPLAAATEWSGGQRGTARVASAVRCGGSCSFSNSGSPPHPPPWCLFPSSRCRAAAAAACWPTANASASLLQAGGTRVCCCGPSSPSRPHSIPHLAALLAPLLSAFPPPKTLWLWGRSRRFFSSFLSTEGWLESGGGEMKGGGWLAAGVASS